jgi:hypothetical protein
MSITCSGGGGNLAGAFLEQVPEQEPIPTTEWQLAATLWIGVAISSEETLPLLFVALARAEEPGENGGEERLETSPVPLRRARPPRTHLSSAGSHRAAARGLGGAGSSSQE